MASGVIGPLSNLVNNNYDYANSSQVQPVPLSTNEEQKPRVVENTGESDKEKKAGRRSTPQECETCKNRKYKDGSNENVSFKSPAHISAAGSAAKVMAHEQEHVQNAYTKAAQNNGKVLSAVVSLRTAVCPECGSTYVEGGTTNTRIKYYGDDNAYSQAKNSENAIKFNGANIDYKG